MRICAGVTECKAFFASGLYKSVRGNDGDTINLRHFHAPVTPNPTKGGLTGYPFGKRMPELRNLALQFVLQCRNASYFIVEMTRN